MKILEKTDTKLLLQYKPGSKFIGIVLVLVWMPGLILLEWLTFTSATLTCQRSSQSQVICELKRFTTLGKTSVVQILNPIRVDIVETRPKSQPLYEAIISTANAKFSLLSHPGGSKQSNQATASQINGFIENLSQPSCTIYHTVPGYLIFERAFLGVGIIAGATLIMTSATVTWAFDKNCNRLLRERKRLGVIQVVSYALSEVTSIQVEQNFIKSFRTNEKHKVYRVILVFAHSEHIALTQDYPFLYKRDTEDIVRCIQQFLGNGFEVSDAC